MSNDIIVQNGGRIRIGPTVPVVVKCELLREATTMTESIAQGVIATDAVNSYFGTANGDETLEKLESVASEIGVDVPGHYHTHPRENYFSVEQWRKARRERVDTYISPKANDLLDDANTPKGHALTVALQSWFINATTFENIRDLVERTHQQVAPEETTATDYKLKNIKNSSDVNKGRFVAEWAQKNLEGRTTQNKLKRILIKQADYSDKQAGTIAKRAVQMLPKLPSARVDVQTLAEQDVANRCITGNDPDNYKRGMTSPYNYTGQQLRAGYACGDYVEALDEELRELFSLSVSTREATEGGRRRRFVEECIARINPSEHDLGELQKTVSQTNPRMLELWDEYVGEWYVRVSALHTRPWDEGGDEIVDYLQKYAKSTNVDESVLDAIESVEELSAVTEYVYETSIDYEVIDKPAVEEILENERILITID